MSDDQDDDGDPRREGQTGLLTRRKLKRPPLYRVLFHNDDYTTRDFVVMALMRYFHKNHAEASTLMLHIHTKGKGIAGLYPYDVAATKVRQVEQLARQHEMPLKLTMEPEDDGQEEEE